MRHLGLKHEQATPETLENKNDCKCIKFTWKLCFWGMWLCFFVLIARLEWDQSDHSYRILVVELCVHMYFPGCWFTRLGGSLFSILWMTLKIYAPESEAWVSHLLGPWKPPFSVTQAVVVIKLAPCLEQAVWLSDSCNQSMELETKKSQIRTSQWRWPVGIGWFYMSGDFFVKEFFSLNIIHQRHI